MKQLKGTKIEDLIALAIKAQDIKEESWDEKRRVYKIPMNNAIGAVLGFPKDDKMDLNGEQLMQFEILWVLAEKCWNEVQLWDCKLNQSDE